MVAVVAALGIKDCRFQQLDIVGRLLLNQALQRVRYLRVWPLTLDRLSLHAHATVDVIYLTVRAFLVADQKQRHRHKVDRRNIVTRLHHHASRADCQIQQEFTDSNVKV